MNNQHILRKYYSWDISLERGCKTGPQNQYFHDENETQQIGIKFNVIVVECIICLIVNNQHIVNKHEFVN